ncbi:MAG: prepilin-type N-terminal cleavage/methylation domain-containing protein [Candidatus Hydrogenedens sp.]|nr:prepilin-type N-terminal cleavage/methylation domain-containing protein [Candidatus Hydrogenedens sp.]
MTEQTKNRRHRRGQGGFTLVELMVVIAIIAILATIVGVNVFGQIDTAGVGAAQAQIKNFESAVVAYRLKNRKMPTTLNDLLPFMNSTEVPKDPWNNDYVYKAQGSEYEIICYGADGAPGGTEMNADISSKNLQANNN